MKKKKAAYPESRISVHGLSVEEVIANLLHVAAIWGKKKPTKANINKHGFDILSSFYLAFNMRPVFTTVIDRKKKKRKK